MNKTLTIHLDAIRSGEVTKTNVIGMRKAINMVARKSSGGSVPETCPDWRDMEELEEALYAASPRVAPGELHDGGLKVLRNPRYRSRWSKAQAAIIADLDHFELVRYDMLGKRGEYAQPVYRAVDTQGAAFVFVNVPWQSGGRGPEVLSE